MLIPVATLQIARGRALLRGVVLDKLEQFLQALQQAPSFSIATQVDAAVLYGQLVTHFRLFRIHKKACHSHSDSTQDQLQRTGM